MLRIDYTDPEIRSLDITDITAYLNSSGWRRVKRDPHLVFEGKNDDDGNPIQIVLPWKNENENIRYRIAETISLLSAIEDRSPYEVIRAIRAIDKDIVIFKPNTYKISLEKAKSYINKIRQYYNYSASVEAEPCPYFIKSTKKGREFVEKSCFFGHTFKGSFGFTIETNLLPRTQVTLDGDRAAESVSPFERRVVERIVRGIKSAQESAREANPDLLVRGYETGLNANMCDVLADIIEEFNDIDTEFYVSWAPSYDPPADLRDIRISLDSSVKSYLKSASKTLSGAEESQIATLTGKIIELKRPPSDDEEEVSNGENHIIIHDESEKNVTVLLTENEYKQACNAHRDKISVSIQGTLEKDGKYWVLRAPHDFILLGSASSTNND